MEESREELHERYDAGVEILRKLFEMSDADIKSKIKSICSGFTHLFGDLLNEETKASTRRVISNEKPSELTITCYDKIEVSPFGITFKPEHGPGKTMVQFNKHFVL